MCLRFFLHLFRLIVKRQVNWIILGTSTSKQNVEENLLQDESEGRHDDKFCQPKTMSKKTDSLQLGRPRQITTKFPSSANNTKEEKVQDSPWMVSFSVVTCESL